MFRNLTVTAHFRADFARARRPLLAAALAAWAGWAVFALVPGVGVGIASSIALQVALPALVLLLGYWLSGLLFVRPDVRLERWLQAVDERILTATGLLDGVRRAPRVIREYLELSYLLVYLVVPAGALTLALGGHADRVGWFWAVVLLAEFTCYGTLPWVQTRPPRTLEAAAGQPTAMLRRLNESVARRASIQVNTLPSGHAAGAVAAALAVGSAMPLAGSVFLLLAASIVVATVLGRYHYLTDSALGVLVAVAIWCLA
jgi:membrane-associated phospholipid phosphatase